MNMESMQYTLLRFWAILKKESILIKRDIITYIFFICLPFSEVILFGYIINIDAKHLPTVIMTNDSSPITNNIISAFNNTGYFSIHTISKTDNTAEQLLKSHKTEFIITIPENFSRDLIRNKQPHILVEGDATDPVAIGNAFHAAAAIPEHALKRDLSGSLSYLQPKTSTSFFVDTHAVFNPSIKAQYHTLPGLIIAVLSISLTLVTSVSLTSEYEHGTMEMLLITPTKPLDIILGKIVPNILLGYILFFFALSVSHFLFHVPFLGSLTLLTVLALPFIICNLGIGMAISSITKTQFQAATFSNTYILPAILFSGFMFPFYGMPKWAQAVGQLFPTTHFMRIVSGIMLKNADFFAIWPDLWPLLLFMILIVTFSYRNYRLTLD